MSQIEDANKDGQLPRLAALSTGRGKVVLASLIRVEEPFLGDVFCLPGLEQAL